ncbi:MAG: TIGR02391 family protein [Actinobacteria bacterium]|nr:TIGR02391 family protein [Actinomycetota bacterium]
MSIADRFPEPSVWFALSPQELAGYLLEDLIQRGKPEAVANIAGQTLFSSYPQEHQEPARMILMEAWVELLRDGLVAPEPGSTYGVYFVTRRGREVATQARHQEFLHARLFPVGAIHPLLDEGVFPLFLRRQFEAAVFQAFKTVEVEVRRAGQFLDTEYGVDLMRTAFHPDRGVLSDPAEPKAEREALAALFAGAIGRFKNPSSHRHVQITDAREAVEMIQFASHLLRIVDQRRDETT